MLINSILVAPSQLRPSATGGAGLQRYHHCRLIARHGEWGTAPGQPGRLFVFLQCREILSFICSVMGGAAHSYAEKIQETKRSVCSLSWNTTLLPVLGGSEPSTQPGGGGVWGRANCFFFLSFTSLLSLEQLL